MENDLIDSNFIFKTKKLCCMPCAENAKKSLLAHTGIAEVDADLEKNEVMIKGNIDIVKLITMFQETDLDAELVYYKKETLEDHDHQTENHDEKENDYFCDSNQDEEKDTGSDNHMFKHRDQRKASRGRKEKVRNDNEAEEDIGADHYKIRNTFKDHKPEKYVPPKEEHYWGDVRSGMHRKFPMMPGSGSWFSAGFQNYNNGYYYPAPWPQQDYM